MKIFSFVKFYLSIIVDGFMPRRDFLFKNNVFSLGERIQLIMPGNKIKIRVIKNRICKDENQRDFIDLGIYKVYFDVDVNIINKDMFLKGITQVVWETFVIPEFLHPIVSIKKGDIVFDVGANIGTTTLLFSGIVGRCGKVYSFEPVTFKTIMNNVTANNVNNVVVVSKGISLDTRKSKIGISDFCLDSSILERNHTRNYYTKFREIELTSIDDFCEENQINKIDFIKVDIEGAEEFAIRGAENMIKKCHPKWSISSYHIDSKNEPQHSRLLTLLKEFGYKTTESRNVHIWAF